MKKLLLIPLFSIALAAHAANVKITDLPALTTPATDDLLEIVDTSASASKKITLANLSTVLSPVFSNLTSKPTTLSGYGITDAQGLDADLTAIAAVTTTSTGRSLLAIADAAAGRTALGISTDRQALTSTLSAIIGGSGCLDGIDVSGYTEGQEITFKLADIHYRYRLADSGTLPTEATPTYVLPDTPSGTKFWVLVESRMDSDDAADMTLNIAGGLLTGGAVDVNGTVEASGSVQGSGLVSTGSLSITGAFIATPEAKSGAGALSVSTLTTRWTTTAADAGTLANGTNGQLKIVTMVVDGGDGTLTPTTKTGFTSVTFDAVGDSLTLQYHTTLGWMIVSHYGCTVTP